MVCYDKYKSTFFITRGAYTFYFSSMYNRSRFISKEDETIEHVNHSLSSRFKLPVDAREIAWFKLYRQVEKRWFHVKHLGGEIEWVLDGQNHRETDSPKLLANITQS